MVVQQTTRIEPLYTVSWKRQEGVVIWVDMARQEAQIKTGGETRVVPLDELERRRAGSPMFLTDHPRLGPCRGCRQPWQMDQHEAAHCRGWREPRSCSGEHYCPDCKQRLHLERQAELLGGHSMMMQEQIWHWADAERRIARDPGYSCAACVAGGL